MVDKEGEGQRAEMARMREREPKLCLCGVAGVEG